MNAKEMRPQQRRTGRGAKRPYEVPRTQYSSRSDARQRASQDFKAGFYLGLLVGLVILCAVLFLWAVPTVDGCVEDVRQMQEQMLQQSSAVLA